MTEKNLPAQSKADDLDREVSLRGAIDPTGLTVAGKSRFLAAADRLLGGLVGWPAAHAEGIRARKEARNDIELAMIRADGAKALQALSGLDELGQATAHRFVQKERRKQLNLEGVWVETVEALKLLPPPTHADEHDGAQGDIDEDWINIFADYAELASSERLRELWGRILAGQIRKPGAFAPATLRLISEMDAEIARTFQGVTGRRLGDHLRKPPSLENEELLKWSFLEEVGLLQGVTSSLRRTIAPTEGSNHASLTLKTLGLGFTFPDDIRQISYTSILITRAGQQISGILDWDEEGALRDLAATLPDAIGITLFEIVEWLPGNIRFRPRTIDVIRPFAHPGPT